MPRHLSGVFPCLRESPLPVLLHTLSGLPSAVQRLRRHQVHQQLPSQLSERLALLFSTGHLCAVCSTQIYVTKQHRELFLAYGCELALLAFPLAAHFLLRLASVLLWKTALLLLPYPPRL